MKHLNFLSKSSSRSCGHRVVTLCTTVGSPSAHRRGTTLKHLAFLLLFLFSFGVGNVWGARYSLTPNQSSTGSSSTSYISTLTEFTYPTTNGITWKMNYWNPSNRQVKGNQSSASSEFRFYNNSAFAGKITKVVITFGTVGTISNSNGFMFLGGTSAQTGTSSGASGTWNSTAKTITWTPASNTNYTYFAFYQNGKVISGNNYLASSDAIVVTYLTAVTLNKNGGSENGAAKFDHEATAYATSSFTPVTRSNYNCTGYWTATSGGTKILNADGSIAAANITVNTVPYTDSNKKWVYTDGTLTLYAQWESSSANPTISTAVNPTSSGTVVIKNSSNQTVASGSEFSEGDEFTLTATPNSGYKFAYWSLSTGSDAILNNADENPTSIMMIEESTTVTANFAQPATVGDASNISCTGASFAVSNSANRNNYIVYTTSNTATPSGTWSSVKYGNGTITISSCLTKNTTYYYWCASEAASGHYVYTDRKSFSTSNGYDLDLTTSDGKGNTASAPSYSCIAAGTSVTLTASPTSGYVVSGWTVLDGSANEITPTSTTATTFTFNMPTSNVTAEAIFQQQVVAPTFSPAAGTYGSAQNVAISTTTPNATIYYTIGTNPAAPTTGSTPYTSAISVSSNQTIKAIAVKDGMANSAVSTAAYAIKCAAPTFVTAGGTYTGAQSVAINVPTGTTVYYTTDGSTPDNTKTEYTGAINVAAGMTIKAIAVKDGMANSDVASATYTIQYTVTWKVNGVALSGVALGDATVLVTAGGKVSKLPTDPTPSCGDRFMGWTNSDMGSTMGQSAPGVLFKTAASAPDVNGTTTYHAVFADYAN